MFEPKISIITITYNSEKTLEETIKSVVAQNYSNLEYLIIDGNSKDGTLKIIERYRNKISLVISEPDKGISDAFNKGIHYATGDIIGIINSDDLLAPNTLRVLSDNYDESIDVYRGNTVIWNETTDTKISMKPTMAFSLYDFKRPRVCHPSTFITKHAYNKYGTYKINFKYRMDLDLLIRLYNRGAKFKLLSNDLAIFRLGGTTNSSYRKKLGEVYELYKENGANIILVYLHIINFIIYELGKQVLSFFVKPDKLRRKKYEK